MHVVLRFWEPRGNAQCEQHFRQVRGFSLLNEGITIICAEGIRHCFPLSAIVEFATTNGESHENLALQ